MQGIKFNFISLSAHFAIRKMGGFAMTVYMYSFDINQETAKFVCLLFSLCRQKPKKTFMVSGQKGKSSLALLSLE